MTPRVPSAPPELSFRGNFLRRNRGNTEIRSGAIIIRTEQSFRYVTAIKIEVAERLRDAKLFGVKRKTRRSLQGKGAASRPTISNGKEVSMLCTG